MFQPISIDQGCEYLAQGKIIAYPTEAVFGLGCCPMNERALQDLLVLKQRPWEKGLILIASHIEQLLPFIDISNLTPSRFEFINTRWPGPYTFVFSATENVLPLVKGEFSTVAVRVTAHPIANQLCKTFGGAIVSTSANESTYPPFKKGDALYEHFGEKIAGVIGGEVGNALEVTSIQDAVTGEIYR